MKYEDKKVTDVGNPLRELDTPTLWVDLDIMEHNIAWLAERFKSAGVQWRPHTKSLKIPEIAQMALQAGAVGITCAKLSEAEVMSSAGIRDILIANQIVGAKKIARLVTLLEQAKVRVAVDNADNVLELGAAAAAKGLLLEVLIEVDVGLKRAGVQPGEEAVALAQLIVQTPGLRFAGLMAWEGHATLVQNPEDKRKEIEASISLLLDTVAGCRGVGIPVEVVSAGGSATADYTPFIAGITEIQAGGGIFSDVLYQTRGVVNPPALFIQSLVTSRPSPERIIFDAGFKTLPAWNASPRLLGVDDVVSVRMSAEHATVTLGSPNSEIRVGDVFDFVVAYGDFTVFLHDQLFGIRKGIVEVVWDIVGRGKIR